MKVLLWRTESRAVSIPLVGAVHGSGAQGAAHVLLLAGDEASLWRSRQPETVDYVNDEVCAASQGYAKCQKISTVQREIILKARD